MRFLIVILISALALLSAPVNAIIISTLKLDEPIGNPAIFDEVSLVTVSRDDVGEQFVSSWFLSKVNTEGLVDLQASALWTITSFTDQGFGLNIEISNDTERPETPTDYNSSIMSFGFATNPDTIGTLTTAGSTFNKIGEGQGNGQSFPGGFKGIDICIFAAECNGGTINQGLGIDESDTLDILLAPIEGVFGDSFELSVFAIKFQGTDGSYQSMPNTTSTPDGVITTNSVNSINEPSIYSLFIMGGLMLAFRKFPK